MTVKTKIKRKIMTAMGLSLSQMMKIIGLNWTTCQMLSILINIFTTLTPVL